MLSAAVCHPTAARSGIPSTGSHLAASGPGRVVATPALSNATTTIDAVIGPVAGAPRPLPSLEAIRGVLFDVDGTLCHSDPLHLKVFQDKLLEVGFNDGKVIDEEFFRQHIAGRHNPDIMSDLFPSWTEERQIQFTEDKEAAFRQLAGDGGLDRMPGLSEFMAWLETKGLGRVAVTNAPRLNAECMLDGMRITGEFSHLIIGEECPRAKPFPDPYLLGLEALGIEAHQAIAIEDSPSGMRAAVAAGIPAVGILSGQSPEALLEAGASYLIRDYHDLMVIISPTL